MKRALAITLAVLINLALSFDAIGAGTSAVLAWTNPTAYVDGSPLPAADIAGYTITWTGPPAGSVTLTAGAVTTATVPIPCGSVNFVIRVNTTPTALYPSASSADSSPPAAYATGVKCAPGPVSAVTVH